MKSGFLWGIIGVVVIIGVVWAVMRSGPEPIADEPTVEQTPLEQEPRVPEGQFVQEVPEDAIEEDLDMAEEEQSAGEAVTVQLTDAGFSPSTLTVAPGTTVTFVNNGQAQHWPASDVHPTHQLLPGFDAKQGLETGETYSYTFTEAGEWTMHDHLFPQFTGTVTVE